MSTYSSYFHILNPLDQFTNLVVDGVTYATPTEPKTAEELVAIADGPFSFLAYAANLQLKVLKVNYDTDCTPVASLKQYGTDIEFGLEKQELVGGQPTTPPWLKPKP